MVALGCGASLGGCVTNMPGMPLGPMPVAGYEQTDHFSVAVTNYMPMALHFLDGNKYRRFQFLI